LTIDHKVNRWRIAFCKPRENRLAL
jgi:hypothetical protein